MGIHFVLIYLYAIKSPKLEMGLKVWASILMLAGIVIIITTILIDPNLSSLTSSKSINGIASLLIGVVIYLIAADYIEPDIPPIESHIDHLIED